MIVHIQQETVAVFDRFVNWSLELWYVKPKLFLLHVISANPGRRGFQGHVIYHVIITLLGPHYFRYG